MRKMRITVLTSVVCIGLVACSVANEAKEETVSTVHESGQKAVDEMEYPITGGTTDQTNYDAPKEITSKNIVEFATRFYVTNRDSNEYRPEGQYEFEIKPNGQGEYVLTSSGVYQHEMVVSQQVLADVQDIIDQYELTKKNGDGKITAGLPPKFEPWLLDVEYDSGERLYFYETGTPDAYWTTAFRNYFIDVMADAGFEDVLPPKEAMTIERFSLAFDKDGASHSYSIMNGAEEGTTFLDYYAMDMERNEIIAEEEAEVTDAFYEGLQDVILANGIESLHKSESVHFNLERSKAGFLEIYVDYESGRQIYGEYSAADLPKEWPKMRDALMDYLDRYIQENAINKD